MASWEERQQFAADESASYNAELRESRTDGGAAGGTVYNHSAEMQKFTDSLTTCNDCGFKFMDTCPCGRNIK